MTSFKKPSYSKNILFYLYFLITLKWIDKKYKAYWTKYIKEKVFT